MCCLDLHALAPTHRVLLMTTGPVQQQIAGVAKALAEFQPVTVCANPDQACARTLVQQPTSACTCMPGLTSVAAALCLSMHGCCISVGRRSALTAAGSHPGSGAAT